MPDETTGVWEEPADRTIRRLEAEVEKLRAIVDACAVECDGPCYYCGEPVEPFSANPGLWPLHFAHHDEPGIVKLHHTGCVTQRLAIADKLPRTADDVPVVPGMTIWQFGRAVEVETTPRMLCDWFSTRKAAEAAEESADSP